MAKVVAALKNLDAAAQQRVLDYAVRRLKLTSPGEDPPAPPRRRSSTEGEAEPVVVRRKAEPAEEQEDEEESDGLEGVNVVAQKWIKRSGLAESQVSALFSLGVDEIDLVARSVPGKTKIERLKNVLLLKGVAAYLSSGTPRVDWAKLKEAAGHYDADAGKNVTTYMKSFGAEASGSVASGYTLTSRGLTEAKELIKQMTTTATKS
jgi:hypothetical protein